MLVKKFILLEGFETNTYLVWDKDRKIGIVIDPADRAEIIKKEIDNLGLKIKYIVNTHGHGDHIGANDKFKKLTSAKICIHKADSTMLVNPDQNFSSQFDFFVTSPPADILLKDGDEISFGNSRLKVIHTPGHSKGGICLLGDGKLFSGDTLFFQGIGRTDLPFGNESEIIQSINEKLFILPEKIKVYPGHGGVTTIHHEKKYNPVSRYNW